MFWLLFHWDPVFQEKEESFVQGEHLATAQDQLYVTSQTLLTLTKQFKDFVAVAGEAGTQLK